MFDFKGAIFDLDGTLIDSMNVWNEVDVDFFANHDIPMPDDYTKTIAPMGVYNAALYSKNQFNMKESVEEIIDEWRCLARKKYLDISLKDGAKEYLFHLKDRGVKLAIATASEEELFGPLLKKHGVYDLFDNITTLGEVSRGKGFPDIYEKAAGKMNVKNSECIVFEDILLGIKGAKEGGFIAVGMKDFSSEKDREAIIKICDKFIESFKEMI